jgi:hypothetical protein
MARKDMLWTHDKRYSLEPFDKETDLETAIHEVSAALFDDSRIYLDIKKKIGGKGNVANIPDAHLIDLSSAHEPKLYVVENELAKHEPLKHVAFQILEFSLSFETTPQKVKAIIKERLQTTPTALQQCTAYAKKNGFENVDYLLERIIYGDRAFNALVIIDELIKRLSAHGTQLGRSSPGNSNHNLNINPNRHLHLNLNPNLNPNRFGSRFGSRRGLRLRFGLG